MSSIPNFEDIANYRYNSFTNTITPKKIGYGSNPVEERTIPSSAPYIILLHEAPQQNIPSTTIITDTTTSTVLEEVSKTTTPANNQYRVNYDERGLGQIEFNAGQKGHSIEIQYYGEGSLSKRALFQSIVDKAGDTIDIIGALAVTGGNIILDRTKLFGDVYSQQNLGAIAGLAANTWYFVAFREDTKTFHLHTVGGIVKVGWNPVLGSNQLDMLNLYEEDLNYCQYQIATDNYRVIYVFKTTVSGTNFDSISIVKIVNKPITYIMTVHPTGQGITPILTDVSVSACYIDLLSEFDGTSKVILKENGEYNINTNYYAAMVFTGAGSVQNYFYAGDKGFLYNISHSIAGVENIRLGKSMLFALKKGDVIYQQVAYFGAVSSAFLNAGSITAYTIRGMK